MSNEGKAEIIRPPNTLKAKVREGGPGAVDMDTLAKAENVIASLSDNYLEWVQEDLVRLSKAVEGLKAAPSDSEALDKVFQVAHDMKGQGGSFGYDLITIIGNSLCRFIEGLEGKGVSGGQLEVINIHLQTMKIVIANRMKGDGGSEGIKVLKGIELVVSKVAKK
ncbi:MAG: Hpt domain-containing protein [Rhodospirillales bacterium]